MRVTLLLDAAVALGAAALGLKLLPLGRLVELLRRLAGLGSRTVGTRASAEEVLRAAAVASAWAPWTTCLARALAAQTLLGAHGHRAEVVLGVAETRAGLEAHAWLELGGEVLLGGEARNRFMPLARLGAG